MTHRGRAIDDNVYDLNPVLHPGSVYDHPRDVLADEKLTLAEKRSILASWASDAAAVTSCPSLRAKSDHGDQSHWLLSNPPPTGPPHPPPTPHRPNGPPKLRPR